jgi:hypothetical protein
MSNRHPQRKRKPSKRDKTPKTKKERPVKPLKKPLTCGKKHRTVCEKHGRPCVIEVEWPKGDSRNRYKKELMKLGAPEHTKDSEHRCELCFKERFENSPYQDLTVEGLEELTVARMRRGQNQITNSGEPTPLKPPNDTE